MMRTALLAALVLTAGPLQAQTGAALLRELAAEHETAAEPTLIPRAQLETAPPVRFPALSPDGRYLVYGAREGLELELKLLDTRSLEEVALFTSNRLQGLGWTPDSAHILLELDNAVGQVPLAAPRQPSYLTLLERDQGDFFLGPDASAADKVLVVRRREESDRLERIDMAGETEAIFSTAARIDGALLTGDGAAFVKLQFPYGQGIYLLRDGDTQEIVHCGLTLLGECTLEHYDEQASTLWLSANVNADLMSLFAWSMDTRQLRRVHSDPLGRVDLFEAAFPAAGEIILQYYGARPRNYGLGGETQAHLDRLHELLPGSSIFAAPGIAAWLVREEAATLREPNYYLYDPATRNLRSLALARAASPPPDPAQLSRKTFIEYPARDGRLINGYLSLPRGIPLAEAPLVALVHGGPWGRIMATYSPEVQLLTNRGYAVFEPNFRGSTGFGRDYILAANRDFGDGVVQDDIIDGLDFLLERGIGHPDKLAIAGHSFGGFAALGGLAFTPARFKAAVALAAPADMSSLMRRGAEDPAFGRDNPMQAELLKTLILDPGDTEDVQLLYGKSPEASLQAISAPLLLMAGGRDGRVEIAHVRDYALKLLNDGRYLSLFVDRDEGHGLASERTRAALLYLMEEFLALHLGGRREGLEDADLEAYLRATTELNTTPSFLENL